jgi:hypothetical protein
MSPEIMRIVLLIAGAFVLVNLYQNYQNETVKNTGNLALGEEELAEAQLVAAAPEAEVAQEAAPEELNLAKQMSHDQIQNVEADEEYSKAVKNDGLYKNNENVLPNPQMSNNSAPQGNFTPSQSHDFSKLDCFPKDQLVSKDLLPREDSNNVWNDSNPAGQGHLSNKNFLESGHHYGLNTVGQSLKNPNLQLRSDPLIPMKSVGPWMQSTIEADTNRRQLEIGGY